MAELDIIIPVYNEGQNIAATLRALAHAVKAPVRVLICYDMPEDDTLPAVESSRAEYPSLKIEFIKNSGRGAHAAVMAGFAASSAPHVLVYPADDDYNAPIVDAMLAEAQRGADIVCASRFMRGGSMVGCPPLKEFLVRMGNWVLRHLARVPTHDSSNGFRLFSRRVIADIPVESSIGFTYSIELLVKAHRRGLKIAEVPAQWFERRAGQSRFKVIHWLPAYLRWCMYAFVTTYWHKHRPLTLLVAAVLLLSTVPVFQAALYTGSAWQQVPPVYMDEYIYYAHITEAGTGNILFGNPYLLEHRHDLPLVLFGSNVLAAVPLLAGVPLYVSLVFNFMLWSLVFAGLYYALVRQFNLSQWASAGVALFAYLQSYDQVYRASVRQEVFPFLLLFWIALARFIKNPTRRTMLWLALAAGASFYIYGFLWQTVVVTLGLLALYALATRQWNLLKRTIIGSALGGLIGAPAFGYTVWATSHAYFWESVNRFGLVNTHVPVAELVWSGGWALFAAALAALLAWRLRARTGPSVLQALLVFVVVTGLALFIMQGSNALTGKLWEIGDHIRRFVIVWLPLGTALIAWTAYTHRARFAPALRLGASAALVLLLGANVYFAWHHSHPFRTPGVLQPTWIEQQSYAPPLRWLQEHEPEPVVVWGSVDDFSTIHVPVLTRHYVLFTEAAQFMLMPSDEVRERYLAARYFDGVTAESLKADMLLHAGRANTFHLPKTIERKIKICKVFFFWDKARDCGVVPTPQGLMGEKYFEDLAARFAQDITPNIREYLAKYQVSYVLKNIESSPHWRPEELGGVRVYTDERFELYKLSR